jgi:cytochrome oxidase Cu insertion factor (SCO1/SenC/PrrC family)
MAAGSAAGVVAARRDTRAWIHGLGVLNVALLLGFVVALFVAFDLPQPAGVTELTLAPDFTLPDHRGQPVTLSEAWAQGPVLLVFYRGFW